MLQKDYADPANKRLSKFDPANKGLTGAILQRKDFSPIGVWEPSPLKRKRTAAAVLSLLSMSIISNRENSYAWIEKISVTYVWRCEMVTTNRLAGSTCLNERIGDTTLREPDSTAC